MKKPDKKKILKALKILFGVLVVVFLAWYFWKNWDEFSDKIMNVDMGIFVFSMLFYFAYKITLASLWHYITKLNGCAIKYEKAVTSYLYSILGKYIPGKVFMLAARLAYYKEEDAPLSKVTVCFFIENVCTLLGAAMLFIVSLLFFPNELLENYKWVTIALRAAVLRRYLGSFRDNGYPRDIRALRARRARGDHRSGSVPHNAAERRYGRFRRVAALADYPGTCTGGSGVHLFQDTQHVQDKAEKSRRGRLPAGTAS